MKEKICIYTGYLQLLGLRNLGELSTWYEREKQIIPTEV